MHNLHLKLSANFPWYKKWHEAAASNFIHWTLFIVIGVLATSSLISAINRGAVGINTSIAAAPPTQAVDVIPVTLEGQTPAPGLTEPELRVRADLLRAFYNGPSASWGKYDLAMVFHQPVTVPNTGCNSTVDAPAINAVIARDGALRSGTRVLIWFMNNYCRHTFGTTSYNGMTGVRIGDADKDVLYGSYAVALSLSYDNVQLCDSPTNCYTRIVTQGYGDQSNIISDWGSPGGEVIANDRVRLGWAGGTDAPITTMALTDSRQVFVESLELPPSGQPKMLRVYTDNWSFNFVDVEVRQATPSTVVIRKLSTLYDLAVNSTCTAFSLPVGQMVVIPGSQTSIRYDQTLPNGALISVLRNQDPNGSTVQCVGKDGSPPPTSTPPPPTTGGAHVNLSTNSLSFSGVSGGATPASRTINLSNSSTTSLSWSAAINQTWCHVSPPFGTLLPASKISSGSIPLFVSVDAPSNIGSFTCSITVSGNADNTPQTITATYTVTGSTNPPPPPPSTCTKNCTSSPSSSPPK